MGGFKSSPKLLICDHKLWNEIAGDRLWISRAFKFYINDMIYFIENNTIYDCPVTINTRGFNIKIGERMAIIGNPISTASFIYADSNNIKIHSTSTAIRYLYDKVYNK